MREKVGRLISREVASEQCNRANACGAFGGGCELALNRSPVRTTESHVQHAAVRADLDTVCLGRRRVGRTNDWLFELSGDRAPNVVGRDIRALLDSDHHNPGGG
jgi:hypothetical protein